jgi:endonuclease/exonuclease/phosphatase family metal-dependent hydrolase
VFLANGRGTAPTSLLIGFVLLAANASGLAEETALPAEIRVIHYNLRNYLAMERRVDGEVRENAPKPEREKLPLVKMVARAKPDVLGVCEMGQESDLVDLRDRLARAGIHLPHHSLLRAADEERHLALLSRFPISADRSLGNLTYQIDGATLPFQRGILDVTLEITPAYHLRLIGNHLKSRREVPEGDQAVMRRNEALLVRQHIEKILTEDPATNLLVYGDFNDTRNEATIKTIQGAIGTTTYLRDLPLSDSDGLRWTYYWNFTDVYERIDFAFVSSGLYPEIVRDHSFIVKADEWDEASDHRPIVITVRPQESPRRR